MKPNKELVSSFGDLSKKGIIFRSLPFVHMFNFLCNPLLWNGFRSFVTTRSGVVVPDIMTFLRYTNLDSIEDRKKFSEAYLAVSRLYKSVLFGDLTYSDIVSIFRRYFNRIRIPRYVDLKTGEGIFETEEEKVNLFKYFPVARPCIGSGKAEVIPPQLSSLFRSLYMTKITPIVSEDIDNITRKTDFKEIVYRVGDNGDETSISKYYIPDLSDFAVVSSKDPLIIATILNMLDIFESPFILMDTLSSENKDGRKVSNMPFTDSIHELSLKNIFRPLMAYVTRSAKEKGILSRWSLIDIVRMGMRSSEMKGHLGSMDHYLPSGLYENVLESFAEFTVYRIFIETEKVFMTATEKYENEILKHMLIDDSNFIVTEPATKSRKNKLSLKKQLTYVNRRFQIPLAGNFKVPFADVLVVEENDAGAN